MGAPTVGLILAGLDVDVDNGAAWNRWYDIEHLAPNLALPEITCGARYVAPPALHESRHVDPGDPAWGSGRGVYLTWYATSTDPAEAIATMSARRDTLEAEGRMARAGARVVRTGDALDLTGALGAPELGLGPEDLIHVGHAGLRLVLDRVDRSPRLGPSVVASLRFASRFATGVFAELQLLDRPAGEVLGDLRAGDPRPGAVLDAGFDPIAPLAYGFLEAITASDLPRTIETL
ncbi:MAG: hypothetical protein AAGA90_21410 [Actinomycetota bacterium]